MKESDFHTDAKVRCNGAHPCCNSLHLQQFCTLWFSSPVGHYD